MDLLHKTIFLIFIFYNHVCVLGIKEEHKTVSKRSALEDREEKYATEMFPDTKWCGEGNIAEDYNDLGKYIEADKCCRAHDYCEDLMEGGETKDNLTNTHKFPRLNCRCDLNFYACLDKVKHGQVVRNFVSRSYFNMFAPKCFAYRHTASCVRYETTFRPEQRCLFYEFDCKTEPHWQWFDVPKWNTYWRAKLRNVTVETDDYGCTF